MTRKYQGRYRTNFIVWGIIFIGMFFGTGLFKSLQIYPDIPLWLVWIFVWPLTMMNVLLNHDRENLGHCAILAALFTILFASSWLIHCAVIWLWKARRLE